MPLPGEEGGEGGVLRGFKNSVSGIRRLISHASRISQFILDVARGDGSGDDSKGS